MLGLFIALLVFAYQLVVSSFTMEAAFISGAGFLYTWYLVWAIVAGVILCLVVLGAALGGAAGGGLAGGKVGALLGFIAGGALTGLGAILTIGRNILYVLGAWLLATSGTGTTMFNEFDMKKLIAGSVILFISLFILEKKRRK